MAKSFFDSWRETLGNSKFQMGQASWPVFQQPLAIGDFGEFENSNVFHRRNSCASWGIDPASYAPRRENTGMRELSSEAALTIGAEPGATAPTAMVTGSIHFESKTSHLLRAPDFMVIEIEDPERFGHDIYNAASAKGETPSLMTYVVYSLLIVRQGYFVAAHEEETSMEMKGQYQEIEAGRVQGSLTFQKSSSDQISLTHPVHGVDLDPAVIGFKVLSWNPSGRNVQLNANT